MFLTDEMSELMEEPTFKPVMRGVVKEVIQHLLDSLARHTGDESILLIASTSGPITGVHNAASEKGKTFISGRGDITSQFFDFCKKKPKRGRPPNKPKDAETPSTPSRQTASETTTSTPRQTPMSTRGSASTPILTASAIKQERSEQRTPNPSKHFTRSKGATPQTTTLVTAAVAKASTRTSKDNQKTSSGTPVAAKEKESNQTKSPEKATAAAVAEPAPVELAEKPSENSSSTEEKMETETVKDGKSAILQSLQLKSAGSSGPTRIKVVHQAPVPSTSKEGSGQDGSSQTTKTDDGESNEDEMDDSQGSLGDMTGDISDEDEEDDEDDEDDDDSEDDDDEDEDSDEEIEKSEGAGGDKASPKKKMADACVGVGDSSGETDESSQRNKGDEEFDAWLEDYVPKVKVEGSVTPSRVSARISKRRFQAHKGGFPFVCEYCGKGFKQRRQYNEHIIDHTGELPRFQCDICGKRFKRKRDTINHRNKHSDPKSRLGLGKEKVKKLYPCPDCNKVYKTRKQLKEHSFDHTGGPKPYPCDLCSKTFKRKASMESHRLVHSKPKKPKAERTRICELCGKFFKGPKQYKEHMMNHTGEKRPHTCEVCQRGFKRRNEMRNHIRAKHFREEVFKCKVCGAGFLWKKGALDCYKRHEQTKTKVKEEIVEALEKSETQEIIIQADDTTYAWLMENQSQMVANGADGKVVFVFSDQTAGDEVAEIVEQMEEAVSMPGGTVLTTEAQAGQQAQEPGLVAEAPAEHQPTEAQQEVVASNLAPIVVSSGEQGMDGMMELGGEQVEQLCEAAAEDGSYVSVVVVSQ